MNKRLATYQTALVRHASIDTFRPQEMPIVMQLMRYISPMKTDNLSQDILDRFLNDDTLYGLPIVDSNNKPFAMLDRKHLVEFFSKPYARELFGRFSINKLLMYEGFDNSHPIVIEDSCNVDDAAQIIIDAGMEHMITGFMVQRHGHYCGVVNCHDLLGVITQRKQSELHFFANYDNLTGIANRRLLISSLENACKEAKYKGEMVGLLFIDIDRFKQINDSFGHSVGDAVLCNIANRLQAAARSKDMIARLGGDEFVILMQGITDAKVVNTLAKRITSSLRSPMDLLGHELNVTVSIGSSIYPIDDIEISPLLAKADAAMYLAKNSGRDRFCEYSTTTTMYNPERLSLENDLRHAIEHGELFLNYQPQIHLASDEISGLEALVRWQHPERGLISPAKFIAVAEESGLIVPLGEWVMLEAFRQMREWKLLGLPSIRVAINISARQFRNGNFLRFVSDQLTNFAIDPSFVEIELTESLLMHKVEDVLSILMSIKELGISLAIDDFGTGFSSLSYLNRFPIDRLKIDQSFIRGIESNPTNESIARAIVSLANSLSVEVIAEGIEKPEQLAALKKMHCTEGQGYLFSTPLSGMETSSWITKYQEEKRLDSSLKIINFIEEDY